jgi:hypothetical protein
MYSTTQGGQHRPATKTAMLTMGGVRVQSPYKLLMGCTGAKSTYQGKRTRLFFPGRPGTRKPCHAPVKLSGV